MARRLTIGTVMFIAGSCTIYAVLWLLANYTSIGGGVLMLLIPLALLWLVACLAWVARGYASR